MTSRPWRGPLDQRFWSHVDRFDPDWCWDWTVGTNGRGYGHIRQGGGGTPMILAHRYAYQTLVGPIPEGMQIDHLCRNRKCVNPKHMEIVTREENIRRGNGIPARNARKTECLRGHPFDELNTYRYPRTGKRKCRTCVPINKAANKERAHSSTLA